MANEGTVSQLGPYRLLNKLGEGGMGAVYLADDPAQQRKVALKVLPRSASANVELIKRFRREADAVAKLRHPRIIQGFGAGEDKGFHYFAMEYCDGEPLDRLLKREKLVPAPRALEIATAVAQGLKHAHDQGFIHRDIKPANVFLGKDGSLKILDLGLSKNLSEAERSFTTVTGAVMGTPHYISPEQAQGDKGIDGRTDIYSLGSTFYHLLTGRTPFEGDSAVEIMYKHVHGVMPDPQDLKEDIPDAYVHVLRRMMAKSPADRYANCGDLLQDLDELQRGGTPKTVLLDSKKSTIAASKGRLSKRPPTVRRVAAPAPSKKPPYLWIGLGVAAALGVILFVVVGSSEPPPAPERAAKKPEPPPKKTEPVESSEAAWMRKVAAMPADDQAGAVYARLQELNAQFGGERKHAVENRKLVELSFSPQFVTDLSPLRALPGLERLLLNAPPGVPVALKDLGPLRVLGSLKVLSIHGTSVSDLAPLRGLPLTDLYAGFTKVGDLSPIEGMPLRLLAVQGSPVKSLTPLRGAPLKELFIQGTAVSDLSPLKDSGIENLSADVDAARDRAVLKSMPSLRTINQKPVAEFWAAEPKPEVKPIGPEEQARAVAARLKELNPESGGVPTWKIEGGKVVGCTFSSVGVVNLSPLRALDDLRELQCSGAWNDATKEVNLGGIVSLEALRGLKLTHFSGSLNPIRDLSPLKGMPLFEVNVSSVQFEDLSPIANPALHTLNIGGTLVKDLSPLRGINLAALLAWKTPLTDLSPLKGMPLEALNVNETRVRSLEAVRKAPLFYLDCRSSEVTDLSPLKDTAIRDLWCDYMPARDRAILKSIKTLEMLNGKPAAGELK